MSAILADTPRHRNRPSDGVFQTLLPSGEGGGVLADG